MTAETGGISDDVLRSLVVDTLRTNPGARLSVIQTRLRARTGRQLEAPEQERLRAIYENEGYAKSASDLVASQTADAVRAENLAHARPTIKEIVGFVVAIGPLFVTTTGASTVSRTGGVASSSFFDLLSIAGGIIAVFMAVSEFGLVRKEGAQRVFHATVIAAILALAAFQLLRGFGILHRIGLFQYA
jgi:hypothetical protein